MNNRLILGILATIMLSFLGYSQLPSGVNQTNSTFPSPSVTPSVSLVLGQQTKITGCTVLGNLPDKVCSPGAVFPEVTTQQICTSGYSRSVRNVSTQKKDQVYSEYGITTHSPGQYEMDHLISLELGGSNDIANLWPQPAEPRPGFHEKDQVENYLHSQICSGQITLQDAQYSIANNWLDVYNRMPK